MAGSVTVGTAAHSAEMPKGKGDCMLKSSEQISKDGIIMSKIMYLLKALEKNQLRGTWVAQSGKRPTLGFSSGHDLRATHWPRTQQS